MKIHFYNYLLVVFFMTSYSVYAQQEERPFPKPPVKQDSINTYKPAMIDNEDINRIYVGCDNLYHFRGMTSRKMSAKLGNKEVPQRDGFFILNVADTGKYALTIFQNSKTTSEQVAEVLFHAVFLPEPSAMVANKSCGFISKSELMNSDSLVVKSKRPTPSRVLSYQLALINSKSTRLEFESKNNRLTPAMKAEIRNAPPGSTLRFENIRALLRVRGAGVSVTLPSVSFILSE
jgi:hypothetical protein